MLNQNHQSSLDGGSRLYIECCEWWKQNSSLNLTTGCRVFWYTMFLVKKNTFCVDQTDFLFAKSNACLFDWCIGI